MANHHYESKIKEATESEWQQCDAKYRIFDKDKNLVVTLYCLKECEHQGDHEHKICWEKHSYDSIMGA